MKTEEAQLFDKIDWRYWTLFLIKRFMHSKITRKMCSSEVSGTVVKCTELGPAGYQLTVYRWKWAGQVMPKWLIKCSISRSVSELFISRDTAHIALCIGAAPITGVAMNQVEVIVLPRVCYFYYIYTHTHWYWHDQVESVYMCKTKAN